MTTDTATKQSRQILLSNLRSFRLRLKQPLLALIEQNEKEFICNCPDIDIYGVGDTEQEAIVDFSENLENFFYLLKKEGEKNLGKQMIHIWRFLQTIIEETNATKGKLREYTKSWEWKPSKLIINWRFSDITAK